MKKNNTSKSTKGRVSEFFTVFSMAFGLMVGSGIYLKNSNKDGGVLDTAQQNPILALIVWVLIGVICSLLIMVFIEASYSSKNDEHSTLQTWASKFVGRKFGSWLAFFNVAVYIPIMVTIGGLYTVNTIFDAIAQLVGDGNEVAGMVKINDALGFGGKATLEIVLGLGLIISLTIMNTLTRKPGEWIQKIFSFVKFVPLLIVIIGGFVLVARGTTQNSFDNNSNEWSGSSFLLTSLPIMFAFNGFIDGASIQKDIKNKEVIAPGLLAGVIITTIFYVIISASVFMGVSNGNVFELIIQLFGSKGDWAAFIIRFVIALSILTLANGYTNVAPQNFHSAIDEGFIKVKNPDKISFKKSGLYQGIIVVSFAVITIAISLAITSDKGLIEPGGDSKKYLDFFYVANLLSDTATIFAFTVYIVMAISVLVNRFTKKVDVKKVKGAFICGIIGAVGITIIMAYKYYDLFIQSFIDYSDNKNFAGEILPVIINFSLFALLMIIWGVNEYNIKNASGNKIAKNTK